MEILFATSNKGKFKEAEAILMKESGINMAHYQFSYNEIRSDSLEEIAKDAANAAYRLCKAPVFVEDSGLFIDALDGFPGTYSAWVQKKIGNDGILRLLSGKTGNARSATFRSMIAYHDGKRVATFLGECRGRVVNEPAGGQGFGYDPIFVPENGTSTFAQSIALKNKLSHRYNSLLQFSKYLRVHR